MTYGERRKRADVQLIQKDFDGLESAFLSNAQKLNKKRQAQIVKRVERVIDELQKAHANGDKEEVKGIIASLKMPSSKEWYKLVDKLIDSAVKAGILRAHFELLRLKELYEFDEWEVVSEGYDYDVVLPEEAREFLKKYAYEIGVITEESVLNRIRKTLEDALDEGLPPKDTAEAVRETAGTWMSPWHAQTIARTETGKMYNAGRLARWMDEENNGFVEALQYDAIVDTRTTELCEHLDGRIIAITNGAMVAKFTPPNHYQCRATWLPVTKYEEWEDDFDTSIQPDKGFTFESPLPKLLKVKDKTKKKPIVQPKKRKDPSKITDPDEIRSLDDDGFKKAIKNIKDEQLKLSLVLERAEKMAVNDSGLKEKSSGKPSFEGIYKNQATPFQSNFYVNGKEYSFFDSGGLNWAEINYALQDATTWEKMIEILDAFQEKYGADPQYADLIVKLRDALRNVPDGMEWDGLPVVVQTAVASKLLTIKTPPQTKNYKSATGLQQAVKDGQAWLSKYVIDELAPKTGVRLRFQNDLDRAYATGANGDIFFGRWEHDAGVVVHETAHVIHWNNKEVADMIDAFFAKRTKGEAMTKYMGEDVKKDDFFNPYIGRIYGWEKDFKNGRNGDRTNSAEGFYGQEVLSMGMQAMYTDPEKFYKDDKEHFMLTYAIMRGLF